MRDGWGDVTNVKGTGRLTENGERLLDLSAQSKLKGGGSLFYHKNVRMWTTYQQTIISD